MSESFSKDYRRHGSREDPRLVRRENKTIEQPKQLYDKLGVPISPKHKSGNDSPRKDPRVRESNTTGWQTHQQQNNNYNQSMQTAYQHLPPSIYSGQNQYPAQGYQNAYPSYQQNYAAASGGYNHYQGYGQQQTPYMSGNIQPGPPGEDYPQGGWAPVGGYMNSQPQTQVINQASSASTESKSDDNRKEAVVQEIKQQKAQLIKQREEYVRKVSVLRRELELLRNQKQELLAENSSQHDNDHILRENSKLQDEIQNKMKAIYNVIEMLSSIIRDNRKVSELEEQIKDESPKHRKEKDHNRSGHKSPSIETIVTGGRYNYIHYDPELHWCRICDVFPKTAKDLLLHLQTKEHRETAQERDVGDPSPWHNLPPEPELPHYEGAPKKRLPIKGLQFFISAPAWYCKLCDTWIGDLHCASQHLKSQVHSQNYANFVEQNPHWEIEWLKDREKAQARIVNKHENSDSEDNEKKKKKRNKHSPSSSKDKKRKKKSKKRKKHSSDSSSSSSSSDSSSEEDKSDKSKSIRVAMRNMKVQAIMNEDIGGKWEMLGRLVEEHKRKENEIVRKEIHEPPAPKEPPPEDNLISQWMTVVEPPERDKRLLDSLKDRMKQKQEIEKAKLAELERKQKEREREEQELQEKKQREEREALEREEQKRREREREEFERIRDRDREAVKFKTKQYRRESPERKRKTSRSPSYDQKKSRQYSPEKHRSHRYSENGQRSEEQRRNSYDRSPNHHHKYDDKDSRDSDKKSRKSSNSSKKLPFIGRMPLFKNKKPDDNKVEREIKKEDYDIPRQSRFQPGNLARAFIPEPEVVCFPKLSSIPPITIPPPPPVQPIMAPAPPKISETKQPKTPPPPKIGSENKRLEARKDKERAEDEKQEKLNNENMMNEYQMMYDPVLMAQYQYDYMYSHMYDYTQEMVTPEHVIVQQEEQVPVEHTMPLQPPPLPPDDPNDDLALLGISADDMAVQML